MMMMIIMLVTLPQDVTTAAAAAAEWTELTAISLTQLALVVRGIDVITVITIANNGT